MTTKVVYSKNNISKTTNPQTYSFLEDHKEELGKRDKGNKLYPKWYSFGRTQSLVKFSNLHTYVFRSKSDKM
jgi:hypothetical protein